MAEWWISAPRAEEEKVQTLWLKLYKEYIEAIDAIDNGVNQYDTDQQPKYRIRTDISSRVGFLNPALVLRGAHLLPSFVNGRGTVNLRAGPSVARADGEEDDWINFYVNM